MKPIPAREIDGRRFRVVMLDQPDDTRPMWVLGRIGTFRFVARDRGRTVGIVLGFRCPTCNDKREWRFAWRELEPVREARP